MQDINYVNIHHNYVNMSCDISVNIGDDYVNMQHK